MSANEICAVACRWVYAEPPHPSPITNYWYRDLPNGMAEVKGEVPPYDIDPTLNNELLDKLVADGWDVKIYVAKTFCEIDLIKNDLSVLTLMEDTIHLAIQAAFIRAEEMKHG